MCARARAEPHLFIGFDWTINKFLIALFRMQIAENDSKHAHCEQSAGRSTAHAKYSNKIYICICSMCAVYAGAVCSV